MGRISGGWRTRNGDKQAVAETVANKGSFYVMLWSCVGIELGIVYTFSGSEISNDFAGTILPHFFIMDIPSKLALTFHVEINITPYKRGFRTWKQFMFCCSIFTFVVVVGLVLWLSQKLSGASQLSKYQL